MGFLGVFWLEFVLSKSRVWIPEVLWPIFGSTADFNFCIENFDFDALVTL